MWLVLSDDVYFVEVVVEIATRITGEEMLHTNIWIESENYVDLLQSF